MAYTSDLRVKNILTDIDMAVRNRLEQNNIKVNLEFRVFDESNEDAKLWEDGGLCFKDPITNENLGSNDGGWALNNEPILIVEGTFGTERGQFGDGQLNRISHSLGPALNGIYGVTMVPYHGQSFIKDGTSKGILSDNIKYLNANLRQAMALFSIRVSEKNKGKYLIIDPYCKNIIEDLLFEIIKNKLGLNNDLEKMTLDIIQNTKNYLGDFKYGERSNQTINRLYFTDGEVLDDICRFYSHNLESLTTSTKRDGHGLLGKNLIEMHLAKNKSTAIFIRLDNNDFAILRKRKSKEFTFITTNPRIQVYNFDDLVFEDDELRKKIIDFRNQNLHTDTEKGLMKQIQQSFNNGTIKVKKQ